MSDIPEIYQDLQAIEGAEPYLYNGKLWMIFDNKRYGGTDSKIMDRVFHQLEAMLSHHNKVLVCQFVLRLREETYDNKIVSDFVKDLKAKLKPISGSRLGYVWVREKNKSHKQHYHVALYLNGNMVKTSYRIIEAAQTLWDGKNLGHLFIPKNNYYMVLPMRIDNGLSMQRVIPRLSYFAKRATKGKHSSEVKRYQTSRLSQG